MTNKECRESLKVLLVEDLNLENIEPSDISDDTILFGDDGLGLDSLDAVELTVLIEKKYGVKITSYEEALVVFANIASLADYIIEKSMK